MKNKYIITAITLFAIMIGCGESKQSSNDLIVVDVTKNYPKKELILQDFMDVEYIPLETNDEFICQGLMLDINDDIILVRNRPQDGNIFIFDRKGKALLKINRKGQGSEEYVAILDVILDEDRDEIFVNDNNSKKILVYDRNGNFIRSFNHKEEARYSHVYNFNRENLICRDGSQNNLGQSFMIISKQDGRVTKEIRIPFEEKKFVWLSVKDETSGMYYVLGPNAYHPITPYLGDFILVEPSTDTVYSYSPDHTMTNIIVKTPPIKTLDPEVMLFVSTFSERYYFIESVKKEGDVMTGSGFPSTYLMYDNQEKSIFRYTVYNDDYSTKKEVLMTSRPINNKILNWQYLEAHQLVESFKKGELKGNLKEIAANLDEDSNPVLMLMKHKNKL